MGYDDEYEYGWSPYVSVAERLRNAEREAARRKRQGKPVAPVTPRRRRGALTESFWGRAWCENAEAFASWSNRLDRGRRYLRNGSVFHLAVSEGRVEALVTGSEIYEVTLQVAPLPAKAWAALVKSAQGQVASALDLLQGRLSDGVMSVLTRPRTGLFPTPKQVTLDCTCPDLPGMCKHVAAAFYGVGVRLDDRPELLFTLRGVDQAELIASGDTVDALLESESDRKLGATDDDLGALFGIDLDDSVGAPLAAAPPPPAPATPARGGVEPLPRRLPKRITPALLLAWGIPRSTFQNWIGGALARSGERGVYLRTPETRKRIQAARARLGHDA